MSNLPLGSGGSRLLIVQRLTCPRQRPPGPGLSHPVSGQLSTRHPGKDPALWPAVSCCLSTAGIRFLDTLSRRDFRPHYCRPTAPGSASADPSRTHDTGFTRCTCVRHGPGAVRVGRSLYPGDSGAQRPSERPRSSPAVFQRPVPVIPVLHPNPGSLSHETSARVPC